MKNSQKRVQMAYSCKAIAKPDASLKIAETLLKITDK
jgi:hypothetical protein